VHLHRTLTATVNSYGRLVGLVVLISGGWIFAANLVGAAGGSRYDSTGVFLTILAFGLLGFVCAVGFLLTFDGPVRWRTTKRRAIAWLGMFVSALLPSSLIVIVFPLVLLAAVTIFFAPQTASSTPVH
jgi:hypothetical protein